MSRASRDKGKRGEREAAELLRSFGFDARRAQQYHGNAGSADILSPDLQALGFHVEVKNTSKSSPLAWLTQATEDNQEAKPLVLWKAPRKGWVLIAFAEDVLPIIRRFKEFCP